MRSLGPWRNLMWRARHVRIAERAFAERAPRFVFPVLCDEQLGSGPESQSQRALSCGCDEYDLTAGEMQHGYDGLRQVWVEGIADIGQMDGKGIADAGGELIGIAEI